MPPPTSPEGRTEVSSLQTRSSGRDCGHSLDETFADDRTGITFDLRWIYIHMIEEYARHNGHADLIRELIDGVTGD